MKRTANKKPEITSAIIFATIVGCASQPTPTDNAAAEELIAQPPIGWRTGAATQTPNLRRAEYLPPEDLPAPGTEKLTFESMPMNVSIDPIGFVQLIASQQEERCDPFESHYTFSGMENNYATSVQLFICGQRKLSGRSEVTLLKSIQGNDYFYVIAWERSVAQAEADSSAASPVVSDEEIALWSRYLKSITVCDTRSGEHPCPAN